MSRIVIRHNATVTRSRRERLNGHRSVAVWFTGLSGSGKSTLAHTVEELLHQMGCRTFVFDGDNVRHGLCNDLGFSAAERHENIRRIAEMIKLFTNAGIIALSAFISPYRADRAYVRNLIGVTDFIEVYCRCPIEICEQRDVKGLYRRARNGELEEFTGISAPYEEPQDPDVVIDTATMSLSESTERVIELLLERMALSPVKITAPVTKEWKRNE